MPILAYTMNEEGSKIMDSEKHSPAIDAIARTCIAVRLRLLNRVVTNLYDDALRPLGLKVSQLNLLVVTAQNTDEVAKPMEKIMKELLVR